MINNSTAIFGHPHDFLNSEEKLVLTLILSIMTLLGIFTNALVVYVIISLGRYADVPANLFILNQSIADMSNSVSVICYISHMFYWNWEATYCLFTFTLFSSLGSVCLLTINRLISITWPLKYARRMTPLRAKLLVALVWAAASILTLLHLIGYLVYSDGNFFNYGRYYMMFLVLAFVSSNLYMFYMSRKHVRKIKETFHGVVTGLQRNLKEDLKSVKTVTMVSATFILAWLPLMLIFFLYGSEKEEVDFQRYTAFLSPLMVLNIVLDPLIYYFRSPEFRTFYQRWKRRHGLERTRSRVYAETGIIHKAFKIDTVVYKCDTQG